MEYRDTTLVAFLAVKLAVCESSGSWIPLLHSDRDYYVVYRWTSITSGFKLGICIFEPEKGYSATKYRKFTKRHLDNGHFCIQIFV